MYGRIKAEYFEWLYEVVCSEKFAPKISYRKLLAFLHSTPFTYLIPNDANRAEDGVDLRYEFASRRNNLDILPYLDGPCSVLEMMVALAIRCEEAIMDDPSIGDRTKQWFWNMITNLGLGSMIDDYYEEDYVYAVVHRFLNREYDFDGKGGLFRVKNTRQDMRDIEIWYQLCWYLDSIV